MRDPSLNPLETGLNVGQPSGSLDRTADQSQFGWLLELLGQPLPLRLAEHGCVSIGVRDVQFVPDEHGSEMWGNFPKERQRLLRLICECRANGVVFLTGDRHLAEISRLAADHPNGVGYPLFDVCSSSLNVPSGNMTKSKVRFANEVNSYRVGLTYFDVNFGTVLIDWEPADPVIRLQVREENGDVVLQQRVTLSQLRAKPKQ